MPHFNPAVLLMALFFARQSDNEYDVAHISKNPTVIQNPFLFRIRYLIVFDDLLEF